MNTSRPSRHTAYVQKYSAECTISYSAEQSLIMWLSARPFRCISFTEHCKWAPDWANVHFKSFSCKGMKQSQTSWMNRERIWHEIDIYSQGEANVLRYGLQAHPFSCKIGLFLLLLLFFTPVVSLGYLIVCGASSLSTWILPRRAHLSVVIGSARHKESSVCLDENVDGRDVMRAKGTLRHRGCVLDVLRLSVPHQGLWGVLSVTKDFNFPLPPFASSFICRAAEVLQSPLNHHSPFAQYIWITRNNITTPALLHTFFFFSFFIASAQAFTTLSFMVSSGGIWDFFKSFYCSSDKKRPCGFTGKATVPSCGHDMSLQQPI